MVIPLKLMTKLNLIIKLIFIKKLNNILPLYLFSIVYGWLAFYVASGVGWILFASLPGIVASFKTYSAKRNVNALRERLEELKGEWGDEICGNTPDSSREDDEKADAAQTEAAPA